MHTGLAGYGSRLSSHRVVHSEQLEKSCLIWELPGLISVGVFLEYLQVQCLETAHLQANTLGELGEAALASLRSAHEFEIRVHGVSWMSHVRLPESRASAVLSNAVSAAPNERLGKVASTSATYFYEPVGGRLTTSLSLQKSSLFEEALYLKFDFLWDGKLEYRRVTEDSAALISGVIADLEDVEVSV